MSEVRVLIVDDDAASQAALHQALDSEGWGFKIQPLASEALDDLANSEWTLLIVNVTLSGLEGPLFATLRELAKAPALGPGIRRARVLFLVPERLGVRAQRRLERERLPYVMKPINLHDFLEKVSDLLLESKAITRPFRQVKAEPKAGRRHPERRGGHDRRHTSMFASRDDYFMSEEEIVEFERKEKEEQERKKKKPPRPG